jgi:hypothetical protein
MIKMGHIFPNNIDNFRGVARGPEQGGRKSLAAKFLKSRGSNVVFQIDRVTK